MCIAITLLLFPAALVPGDLLRLAILVCYGIVAIASTVFIFLLAIKVYSVVVGILLGLLTLLGSLTLFPLIGLIVLLLVNGKATKILRQNGIKVGLLGANLKAI